MYGTCGGGGGGGGVLLSKQIARFDADIPWEEQISDIDVQNV